MLLFSQKGRNANWWIPALLFSSFKFKISDSNEPKKNSKIQAAFLGSCCCVQIVAVSPRTSRLQARCSCIRQVILCWLLPVITNLRSIPCNSPTLSRKSIPDDFQEKHAPLRCLFGNMHQRERPAQQIEFQGMYSRCVVVGWERVERDRQREGETKDWGTNGWRSWVFCQIFFFLSIMIEGWKCSYLHNRWQIFLPNDFSLHNRSLHASRCSWTTSTKHLLIQIFNHWLSSVMLNYPSQNSFGVEAKTINLVCSIFGGGTD